MANEDQANLDSPGYNFLGLSYGYGVTWAGERTTNASSTDNGAANPAAIIITHPNDNGTEQH